MAALMITGAKIGAIIGRKRALRDRLGGLRVRVVHDRDLAEPSRPAVRLVVPGAALILPAIVA
jgi:hypothetical protein